MNYQHLPVVDQPVLEKDHLHNMAHCHLHLHYSQGFAKKKKRIYYLVLD